MTMQAIEALVLFAVLAMPYVLLDIESARLAVWLVIGAYLLSAFIPKIWPWRHGRPSWWSAAAAAGLLSMGGAVVAGMLTLSLVAGAHWTILHMVDASGGLEAPRAMTPILMIVVPSAVLLIGLTVARRRREDGPGDLHRWRFPGKASGTLVLLAAIGAFGVAIFGILTVARVATMLGGFMDSMNRYESMPIALELAWKVPALPFCLAAATIMLVAVRRLIPATISVCDLRPNDPVRPLRGPAGLGPGVLICGVALLGGAAFLFQAWIATGLGLSRESESLAWVGAALEVWMDEERADGHSSANIAAGLREHGYWAPETPGEGLAALLAGIEVGQVGEGLRESACRYSVDAAVADLTELPDTSWMLPKRSVPDVRYCLIVSCPLPATILGPERMIIYRSSHPSRNPYWSRQVTLGVFGNDTLGPGGYCTSSGRLAESFQG